jgi:vacuolar protein 8
LPSRSLAHQIHAGAELELVAVARKVAALAEQGSLGEDDEDEDGLLVPALLAQLIDAEDAEIWVLVMAALRWLMGRTSGQS